MGRSAPKGQGERATGPCQERRLWARGLAGALVCAWPAPGRWAGQWELYCAGVSGILTGGGDHVAHASTESFAMRGPDYKSKITTMTGSNLWHNGRPVGEDEEGVRDAHSTHLYTAKSRAYVAKYAQMADVPLFLTVSYQAVHAPIQVPDEYVDGSAYANFDGIRTKLRPDIDALVDAHLAGLNAQIDRENAAIAA